MMRVLPPRSKNKIGKKDEEKSSPFFVLISWKELVKQMPNKALRLQRRREVEQYITYLASPGRILWTNFLAGMARGVGFGVGVAILGAIIVPWLKQVDFSHMPFLGELAREVARLLESRLMG